MYYDLNVRGRQQRDRVALLKRGLELGWDCVAWNTVLAGKLSSATAQQTKPLPIVELDLMQRRELLVHCALVRPMLDLAAAAAAVPGGVAQPLLQMRQLSRLSIILDDVADAQALTIGNEVVKQFDIIAATPGNAKVFAHLCKTADIDVISLDLTRRLPFPLNKKLIDEAVGRGVCFELCYSGMLSSSGARREMLSSSRTLVQYLRGRNVILSSAADSLAQLRGPADAMNVAFVLGLGAENALAAVARNAALVVRHACCRKLRYLPLEIVSQAEFHSRWPELKLPPPPQPKPASSKKRQRDDDDDDDDGDDSDGGGGDEDDADAEGDGGGEDGDEQEGGDDDDAGAQAQGQDGKEEAGDDDGGFLAF